MMTIDKELTADSTPTLPKSMRTLIEKAPSGMAESPSHLGGFAVPEQLAGTIWSKALSGSLADRCAKFAISGQSLDIPAVVDTNRGTTQSGVVSYWETEAQAHTASKPAMGRVRLQPRKLSVLLYMTDELREDASALMSALESIVVRELRFKLDHAILRGTGGQQPLGIYNSPALHDSGSTAYTADAVADCLLALWPGAYQGNPVVVVHPTVYHEMVAQATTARLIAAYAEAGARSLQGMPLIPHESAQATGTTGNWNIVFADMSQYAIGYRTTEPTITPSVHVAFTADETALRFVWRVDGTPLWQKKLTMAGGGTAAPFVGTKSA